MVADRPDAAVDPILRRNNNMAAVSWVCRSGGATDRRACLLVRMPGGLELAVRMERHCETHSRWAGYLSGRNIMVV